MDIETLATNLGYEIDMGEGYVAFSTGQGRITVRENVRGCLLTYIADEILPSALGVNDWPEEIRNWPEEIRDMANAQERCKLRGLSRLYFLSAKVPQKELTRYLTFLVLNFAEPSQRSH